MSKNALIIVDVQYDFVEGGSMGVDGGLKVADNIIRLLQTQKFDYIITTQDWHINPGDHFSDEPDFVDSWPVHCVANSHGAKIVEPLSNELANHDNVISIHKGMYDASYSGFDGVEVGEKQRSLDETLLDLDVKDVYAVGIAADYCVYETALDAYDKNYDVTVYEDCTVGINQKKVNTIHHIYYPALRIKVERALD